MKTDKELAKMRSLNSDKGTTDFDSETRENIILQKGVPIQKHCIAREILDKLYNGYPSTSYFSKVTIIRSTTSKISLSLSLCFFYFFLN